MMNSSSLLSGIQVLFFMEIQPGYVLKTCAFSLNSFLFTMFNNELTVCEMHTETKDTFSLQTYILDTLPSTLFGIHSAVVPLRI